MKNFYKFTSLRVQRLLSLPLLVVALLLSAEVRGSDVATVSYYCNFEDTTENAKWKLHPETPHSTLLTQWEIGRATHAPGGRMAMYTSMDGGINTGSQQKSGGFCVSAYRVFHLEAGTYTLSFDWRAGNEELAVSVAPIDTMTNAQMRVTNSNFPQLVTQNKKKDGLTNSAVWQHETITLNLTEAGSYSLIFSWRSNGRSQLDFGGAVDNIELIKNQTVATACDYAIRNFTAELQSGQIMLNWQGNASRYELMYFGTDDVLHSVDTLTTTTCAISLENLTDGVYTFQVRGVCEDGNATPWAFVKNILVYDPANHCIDFLNFHSANVLCEYGTTGNSTSDIATRNRGVINHGYQSNLSRHTVHYVSGETDPRTNNQLRTVPEGSFASVRLGNWEVNSEWESITYTITLDSTMGVLQFKYAMVDENPSHGQDEQPRFDLKILNANGQLLAGQCGTADFRPPTSGNGDGNWHTIGSGYDMVQWRDWTTVGLNVRDYVGQTIKVQITNFDCSQSGHYGYCYFTLDCSDGKLQGVTCGEKPREMTADEGFRYRWYKPYAMDEPFYEGQDPTARSLYVSPNDSNTYYVNLISKTNNQCYFTLQASALGQFPKARVKDFAHTPEDCINQISITNSSGVFGYFTDQETGAEVEVDLSQKVANQRFTIRTASGTTPEYTVDSLGVETIKVSNDGDSVYIHMYIAMDEGCYDEADTMFIVPAIGETHGMDSILLCQGDEVHYIFDGQDFTFTKDGDYELSRIKNWAGCDSTFTVHVDYQYSYIFQRWDDVLSVWGNDLDDNRYDYTSFQWLKNGQPIEGATQSYYLSPEPLSENDNYQVVLTFGDGTEETSCEYTPSAYTASASLAPTQVQAGQLLTLTTATAGIVEFISTTGLAVKQMSVAAGQTTLTAPTLAGYYFVKLTTPEFVKVFKVSVR